MHIFQKLALFTLFNLIIFTQCGVGFTFRLTSKFGENDPFKNEMVESQFFEINADSGQVIEGQKGIRMAFPAGCFVDAHGKRVRGKVRIELAEALDAADMLRSNLTTLSNNAPLETDGMMYWNATANGAQLGINRAIPVGIEIPTRHKIAGMQAYFGERDQDGNMNWTNPLPIENYLDAVDIFSLDFLPAGFYETVANNLPFGPYTTISQALADSLYYSMDCQENLMQISATITLNEPYYQVKNNVKNGQYNSEDYVVSESAHAETMVDSAICGIDPAMIKAIRSEQFQSTFLATRAFQQRLQSIFATCDNEVLEAYVHHLDKNLWECDLLAADLAEKNNATSAAAFRQFAELKETKIRNSNVNSTLLRQYFEKAVKSVQQEIAAQRHKLADALNKKETLAQKTMQDYKQLLWKREKYRMETYGFEWTQTGWINVDKGTLPKTWGPAPLEVWVENSSDFDRVYNYVVYTSIKSIYRLNTRDNTRFFVGNEEEKTMLMPKQQNAILITLAYKGPVPALAITEFETGVNQQLTVHPELTTTEAVSTVLNDFNKGYKGENQIADDMAFMDLFYEEEQRKKNLLHDSEVVFALRKKAFPCQSAENGKNLFLANCASCHHKNMMDRLTGPALCGVQSRWKDDAALYRFIRNSQQLIAEGHPRAVAQWMAWKPVLMNSFESLSDRDIGDILFYIDTHCVSMQ